MFRFLSRERLSTGEVGVAAEDQIEERFALTSSRNFPAWLDSTGTSIAFTTYQAGSGFLNVQLDPGWTPAAQVWGRVIFWVADVDAVHRVVVGAGFEPTTEPADAPWGERYFHVHDPSGHEISFARLLTTS